MEFDLFPRAVLNRLGVPTCLQRDVSLLISSLLVLLILPVLGLIPHVCLMQTLLHVPCPGCGVSHAMMAACQLNFGRAWGLNPGGLALAVFLMMQVVVRPVVLLSSRLRPAVDWFSQYGSGVVLASLLVVWIYRMHHYLL